MKSRCFNPKDTAYADYGGRGIGVCERWMTFDNFLADMGERPAGTSLDRLDVNGDYTPANARWASPSAQSRNKRDNRLVMYMGRLVPLVVVAHATGIPYGRLWDRIVTSGWSIERAISEPVNESKRRGRK